MPSKYTIVYFYFDFNTDTKQELSIMPLLFAPRFVIAGAYSTEICCTQDAAPSARVRHEKSPIILGMSETELDIFQAVCY